MIAKEMNMSRPNAKLMHITAIFGRVEIFVPVFFIFDTPFAIWNHMKERFREAMQMKREVAGSARGFITECAHIQSPVAGTT